MKEMHRAMCGGQMWSFLTLAGFATLQIANLKELQTLCFWVFMEASLYRHYWLNYWPLVMELSLQPLSSPLPGGLGVEVQVPTL